MKVDLLRCLVGLALLASFFPLVLCGLTHFVLSVVFQWPLLTPEVSGRLYLPQPDTSLSLATNVRSFLVPYGPALAGSLLAYVLLFTEFGKRYFSVLMTRRSMRGVN